MPTTTRYTVIDGEFLSENRNGTKRDYVPDPLGSTIALLDNTQTQTDTFSYYPYGEVASRTGTTATPFQFVGTLGYYQDNSGRTYVRARHLRTAHGRWMTQDPIGFRGGDANLYRYASNSPTTYTDASGLAVWVCGTGSHQFISTTLCGAWGFDNPENKPHAIGIGVVGNCDIYLRPTYSGDLQCPLSHNIPKPTSPLYPHIPGAGVGTVKCEVVSKDPKFEDALCKCISASKGRGIYLNPYIRIRNCNTWVGERLDCACMRLGKNLGWSPRNGKCQPIVSPYEDWNPFANPL